MECADCKGTRVYVGLGFFPAEPCRRCAGLGVEPLEVVGARAIPAPPGSFDVLDYGAFHDDRIERRSLTAPPWPGVDAVCVSRRMPRVGMLSAPFCYRIAVEADGTVHGCNADSVLGRRSRRLADEVEAKRPHGVQVDGYLFEYEVEAASASVVATLYRTIAVLP